MEFLNEASMRGNGVAGALEVESEFALLAETVEKRG
jgi:hypothetical protein